MSSNIFGVFFVVWLLGVIVYMSNMDSPVPYGNPLTKIGRAKNRYRKRYQERVVLYMEQGYDYHTAVNGAKDYLRTHGIVVK